MCTTRIWFPSFPCSIRSSSKFRWVCDSVVDFSSCCIFRNSSDHSVSQLWNLETLTKYLIFMPKVSLTAFKKFTSRLGRLTSTRARCNRGDAKSISYKQKVYFQFWETFTKECQIYHRRDISFTKIKIYFQIQETLTKENQFYHNDDIRLLMK